MTLEVRIDESGRLAIPEGLRDQLSLAPGSLVQVSVEGRALLVRHKSREKTADEMEKFDQALMKWTGVLRGNLEADGFESVDAYMKAVRSR